jgi:hypothetical protein
MTKKEPLEIEGLMDNDKIRWKKISCKCDHSDPEKEYPVKQCIHCKCQENEDSMPRTCFDVIEPIEELKNDKWVKVGDKKRTVTKIKIIRGKKYDDIMGWVF